MNTFIRQKERQFMGIKAWWWWWW